MLQHKGLTAKGAWVPNWQFDAICLESSLAERLASSFELEMRAVEAPGGGAIDGVMQIVVPSVGRAWFDRDQLQAKAIQTHGSAGSRCDDCRRWRWLPLSFAPMPPPFGTLPPLGVDALTLDVDIAASPEWFGDGWNCFRQILVRRELAEIIAQESPRDFKVNEVV
ncbi:hypothetical protein [Cellulomonas sp. PSBB021]|uniref:hypothetical protein n=1 Tax=Cellulomonas sp. PSBB021 TaxID=2003551 RepID=UPI000B8D8A2A|nr:hypothetical protein [Cellulomonas sp. PSBB021]ASR56402.1 hypothetical protein CBP52_16320 [Cellulomonas sp. PSBB021]